MLSAKGRYREPEMVSLVDPLAPEVPTAFSDACTRLSRAGARVVDLPLTELGEYRTLNARGGFAPTWVRGAGAHAAEVATDNPLNSLVFGIDRSAKHSKIIDTRVFQ
jgi:hypothetical protein